jgi:hypothetical protein
MQQTAKTSHATQIGTQRWAALSGLFMGMLFWLVRMHQLVTFLRDSPGEIDWVCLSVTALTRVRNRYC